MHKLSVFILWYLSVVSVQGQSLKLSDLSMDTIEVADFHTVYSLPYDLADINSANRFFSNANYQYQKGHLLEASNLMKTAIKKQPNRYEYHQLQAYILMDLGDHKSSIRHAEKAVELKKDDWKLLYCLALTKYAAKDYLGANIEYSRAIELDPSQFLLYEGRAYVKSQLNDPLGAMNDFSLAIMIKPTYIKAYFGRGQMLYKLKKYPEAIADFTSVLLREPENVQALYYRGVSRKMLGDISNACADFEKSSKLGMPDAYKELKNTCNR